MLAHGVPNDRVIRGGDWINFDVTCYLDGFFGDTSVMIGFGEVDDEVQRMVEAVHSDKDESAGHVRGHQGVQARGQHVRGRQKD